MEVLRLWITKYQGQKNFNFHTFRDVNKNAYATSVFFRSKTEYSVSCQLVQTRNRVVSMKLTFIPWLELLASAYQIIKDCVKFFDRLCECSVLHKRKWKLGTFILNINHGIRSRSEAEDWGYVSWSLSAEDFLSHGCSAQTLESNVGEEV